MTDRRDSLAEAHEGTFDWAFEEGTTEILTNRLILDGKVYDRYRTVDMNFKGWLRENDGLYTVMGKPGSGKSTFM